MLMLCPGKMEMFFESVAGGSWLVSAVISMLAFSGAHGRALAAFMGFVSAIAYCWHNIECRIRIVAGNFISPCTLTRPPR